MSRIVNSPSPLVIIKTSIERKHEAIFLGVIRDKSLNLLQHIQTVLSKMSRYVRITYKIKRYLPLSASYKLTTALFNRI